MANITESIITAKNLIQKPAYSTCFSVGGGVEVCCVGIGGVAVCCVGIGGVGIGVLELVVLELEHY